MDMRWKVSQQNVAHKVMNESYIPSHSLIFTSLGVSRNFYFCSRPGFKQGAWHGWLVCLIKTKYGPIVQGLEAEEDKRRRMEQRIVQDQEYWATRSRYFSLKHRRRCQDTLRELSSTADMVQLAWAERSNNNTAFQTSMKRYQQNGGRCAKRFKIRLGDFGDEDARELDVHKTLYNSRYYFGHTGGKYIFRHGTNRSSAHPTSSSSGAVFAPSEPCSWQNPCWDSLLQVNEDELQQTYTFCGVVPRTMKEYGARFRVICPKVVRMLRSLVTFGDPVSEAQIHLQLAKYADADISRTQLVDLHDKWMERVFDDGPKRRWARDKTKTHPLILECAFLIVTIGALERGFEICMAHLFRTLQLATGMSGHAMTDAYERIVSQEAFDELLHKRNVENCLLFSGEVQENIHHFFKDCRFESDPVHPLNRFNCLNVESTLAKLDGLSQLDDTDTESSDSELSDPPETETEDAASDADAAAADDDYEEEEEEEKKKKEDSSDSDVKHTSRDPPTNGGSKRSRTATSAGPHKRRRRLSQESYQAPRGC
ncbi:hypothetical protein C2857_000380 [Epichloe festucae Fl1]|uniref:Uncharacterized protein n=1 Tax=Epichloe festucae (strain Fl1) TaxID=877507 RepID=A0A7S9PV47_EPIFF|nr:hypothetical protein C2857_000380 [Epichloe festucae Fl1]